MNIFIKVGLCFIILLILASKIGGWYGWDPSAPKQIISLLYGLGVLGIPILTIGFIIAAFKKDPKIGNNKGNNGEGFNLSKIIFLSLGAIGVLMIWFIYSLAVGMSKF